MASAKECQLELAYLSGLTSPGECRSESGLASVTESTLASPTLAVVSGLELVVPSESRPVMAPPSV